MRNFKFLIIILIGLSCLMIGGCRSHKMRIPYSKSQKGHSHEAPYLTIDERMLTPDRRRLIEESKGWIGIPYKYGGNDKDEGVDCSGMVLQVYLRALDQKLPRSSAQQAEFCKRLKEREVQPGDLVFFATGKDPDRVSHVGIMLDADNFIHSSSSKGVVIASMALPYWQQAFRLYGRVPGVK